MTCQWCGKQAEDAYHDECWQRRNDAFDREDEKAMHESHKAIAAAKRGERVHVSARCMELYGANIKHHRGES